MQSSPMTELEQVIARQMIQEVIVRYARAVDRLDAALLRSTFWEDGRYHKVMNDASIHQSVDQVIAFIGSLFLSTQHVLTNISIEFTARNRARAESYVTAHHKINPTSDALNAVIGPARLAEIGPSERGYEMTMGARYLDTFEYRRDEWRIMTRQLLFEWTQTGAASDLGAGEGMSANLHLTEWPARDRSDPFYAGRS